MEQHGVDLEAATSGVKARVKRSARRQKQTEALERSGSDHETKGMSDSDHDLMRRFLYESTRESFFQDDDRPFVDTIHEVEEEDEEDEAWDDAVDGRHRRSDAQFDTTNSTEATTTDEAEKRKIRQRLIASVRSVVSTGEALLQPTKGQSNSRGHNDSSSNSNRNANGHQRQQAKNRSMSSGFSQRDQDHDGYMEDDLSIVDMAQVASHIAEECGIPEIESVGKRTPSSNRASRATRQQHRPAQSKRGRPQRAQLNDDDLEANRKYRYQHTGDNLKIVSDCEGKRRRDASNGNGRPVRKSEVTFVASNKSPVKTRTSHQEKGAKYPNASHKRLLIHNRQERFKRYVLATAVLCVISAITVALCGLLLMHVRRNDSSTSSSSSSSSSSSADVSSAPVLSPSISLPPNAPNEVSRITVAPALIPTHPPTRMPTQEPTNGSTSQTPTETASNTPSISMSPTSRPTMLPSESPSDAPTTANELLLKDLVTNKMREGTTDFEDEQSPQSRALHWLLADPAFPSYMSTRLLQRFAMAMIYLEGSYSRNRHISLDSRIVFGADGMNGWMTYTDECTWFSTFHDANTMDRARSSNITSAETVCDSDGNLTTIHLEDLSLGGNLSSGLWMLSDTLQTLHLGSNRLESSIPSEIALLSNLVTLNLQGNKLTGSIPSYVGAMSKLESLIISRNDLDGKIPEELSRLSHLRVLSIERNELIGDVPHQLGSLASLETFRLYKNNIVGEMPQSVCNASSINQLYADCDEILCDCCTDCCFQCQPDALEP